MNKCVCVTEFVCVCLSLCVCVLNMERAMCEFINISYIIMCSRNAIRRIHIIWEWFSFVVAAMGLPPIIYAKNSNFIQMSSLTQIMSSSSTVSHRVSYQTEIFGVVFRVSAYILHDLKNCKMFNILPLDFISP